MAWVCSRYNTIASRFAAIWARIDAMVVRAENSATFSCINVEAENDENCEGVDDVDVDVADEEEGIKIAG